MTFYGRHQHFKRILKNIYSNSTTMKLGKKSWKKIKVYFRNSFLGRITELRAKNLSFFLDSVAVNYLINLSKRLKFKTDSSLKESTALTLMNRTKKKKKNSLVRIISMIVIIAIAINIILSFAFQTEITLIGWLVRIFCMFIAILGLICKIDLQTIKTHSNILRRLGIN